MFGTALRSPFDVEKSALYIENLGFDIIGCGEHVSFYGETANSFISLSVASAVTSKVKLMSTITLAPLYPAALLAKMGAALDVVSNGRFIMGVGIGGEFPAEFEACGVSVKDRASRTDEALLIVDKLWREVDVTYTGKFANLNNLGIKPLPIQRPRPPIWVSGRKEAAMRRAAKFGDGWLPYMYTPEQLYESVEKIKHFGSDIGRDMSDFNFGIYIFTAVNEDSKVANEMEIDCLSKQYSQDFSGLIAKYALAGNSMECSSRLSEYLDAGANYVFMSSACPTSYEDENLNLISKQIIPVFREG